MRLGIFGGTFDPVHYGHLLLAESCREQCRLDQVWFLPTAIPPHKQQGDLTPAERRIEMLELAIGGQPKFTVSRYETDRGGVNFTADTLAALTQEDPERELFFLLGGDSLADLPGWRQPERVCALALPVFVRRPGHDLLDFSPLAKFVDPARLEVIRRHQVEMPLVELSASSLRQRVAAGQSIRYRTPRAVEKYIDTHGLYRA